MIIPIKYNLRSLLRRKTRTILTIFGIALVVIIFVVMTAMGKGIYSSLKSIGSPNNIIVYRKGAPMVQFSAMPKDVLNTVKYAPHIKLKDDQPIVSPELLLMSWVKDEMNDKKHLVLVRGIGPSAFIIHNQIELLKGRRPGRDREVIIGKTVLSQFGMNNKEDVLGRKIYMEGKKWTIVGVFEAFGTTFEGEIWTDINDLITFSNRNYYSSISIKINDASNIENIHEYLVNNSKISVDVQQETEYYRDFAKTFSPIRAMGLLASFIVTIGVIFGGMNTMYTAVGSRMQEIGILRILGFSKMSILSSFIVESLIIAIIGGVIGCILSLSVNGISMSVVMALFKFKIDMKLLLQGFCLSLIIGFLGGFLPARLAANMEPIKAIRCV